MIDLHCHLLPGIDDGPRSIDEAMGMARAAVACGTSALVVTPHVSHRYPNDRAVIAAALRALRGHIDADPQISLTLHPGAEIALTRLADMQAGELEELRLGSGPWLLIEPPVAAGAVGIEHAVSDLLRHGHRVVLAHPERCPAFHRDPQVLERLLGAGALASLTAGSFSGRFGSAVRRYAHALADAAMVHNVASDAHDQVRRPPSILPELEGAGLAPLADWLTQAVPAAVLAGDEIPRRPPVSFGRPRRGRWLRWHRRTPVVGRPERD